MKTLELFSGTGSFSKVAKELGHDTYTVDIDPSFKPDLCMSIMDEDLIETLSQGYWDVIWASPPCQGFSIPAVRYHWKDGIPISDTSKNAIRMVLKTLLLIEYFSPRYWFIENPMAMLRKQECMKGLYRTTVTYCQYGDTAMKPTDIWTNLRNWEGKRCKNGSPCHVSAPRGSKTPGSTQGKKDAKERGKIPPELFREIFRHIERSR